MTEPNVAPPCGPAFDPATPPTGLEQPCGGARLLGTSDYMILDASRFGALVKVWYSTHDWDIGEYRKRFPTVDQAKEYLALIHRIGGVI